MRFSSLFPLSSLVLACALSAACDSVAHAQTGTFTNLSALTSVFSSSTNTLGSTDGTSLASLVITITPGTNRILTFSNITGSVDPANTPHGADGGTFTGTGVNIDSLGSISGVLDSPDRALALMGVFIGTTPATGVAPARLDFTGNHSFTTLAPLLNQSFFIGDGLTGTGTGAVQQFFVPNGAVAFQLGFADAAVTSGVPFVGGASAYGDNHGSLSGSYSVTATVGTAAPEPGSLALLLPVLGTVGIVIRRRRK